MPELALKLTLDPALNIPKLNVMIGALRSALGPLGKDIKLLDEAKLRQQIRSVTTDLKGAEDQVKKVNEELGKTGKMPGLGGRAFQFNQLVDSVRNVTAATSELARPFVELDTQVQNIGTLGVDNFKEFGDLAIDLSKRVPESAAGIAAGVYDAISAGITGSNEQIIAFVEKAAKLGVAGMTDTSNAVNGLTSILNAYKLQVSDAGKVSDYLFGAINAGKTTLPELNASLANVVPTAAAAGVSFDQVAAALATMTKQGLPTAQATTQLRQALVEIQKPGATLAPVLERAGVSLASLQRDGLQASLAKISLAMKDMNVNATQTFSSVEAASAVMLLSGDSAQMAASDLDYVRNAIGAAENAYSVAADGIEVKSKVAMNNVSAFFSGAFGLMGSGLLTAQTTLNQLAPTIASISGLKMIIPQGAISMSSKSVQSLLGVVQRIAPSLVTMSSSGSLAFGNLGKAAMAFATSPAGIAIAAIGGLYAATLLLKDALTTTTEEQLEELSAAKELTAIEKKQTQERLSNAEGVNRLSKEYVLLSEQTKSETLTAQEASEKKARMAQIINQLANQYPGVIKRTDDYATALDKVKRIAGETAGEINEYKDAIARISETEREQKSLELKLNLEQSKENLQAGLAAMLNPQEATTGNIITDAGRKLGGTLSRAIFGGLDADDAFKGFSEDLAKATSEMQVKDAQDALRASLKNVNISSAQRLEIVKLINDAGAKRIAQLGNEWSEQNRVNQAAGKHPAVAKNTVNTYIEALDAEIKKLQDQKLAHEESGATIEQTHRKNIELNKEINKLEEKKKYILGENTKTQKSASDVIREQYETARKQLEADERMKKLEADSYIIAQGRSRTQQDDMADAQRELDTLQKIKAKFDELYRVSADGTIGIRLEKTDKASDVLSGLIAELKAKANDVGAIKLDVNLDDQQIAEDLRSLELDQLEWRISLGIADRSEMISELNQDLVAIRAKLLLATGEQQVQLRRQEFETVKSIEALRQEQFDKSMKLLEEEQSRRAEAAQKELDRLGRITTAMMDQAERSGAALIDKDTARKLDALDRQKNAALKAVGDNESAREALEQQYADRRTGIEEEAAKKRTVLESRVDGQRRMQTRLEEIAQLKMTRDQLEEKIASYVEAGEYGKAELLSKELDGIERTLGEKKDVVLALADEFAVGFGQSMEALFAGDQEGMKDSMRATLGLIAGFIEQLAAAAILELVLGSEPLKAMASVFGFAAPIALAGFMALIRAGVHAIIGPILSGITSFGTGGRVDQPTLALVGDAGRFTGSDTEWILRDKEIKAIVSSVTSAVADSLHQDLLNLRKDVQVLHRERTIAKGQDIVISYDRSKAAKGERIRS